MDDRTYKMRSEDVKSCSLCNFFNVDSFSTPACTFRPNSKLAGENRRIKLGKTILAVSVVPLDMSVGGRKPVWCCLEKVTYWCTV